MTALGWKMESKEFLSVLDALFLSFASSLSEATVKEEQDGKKINSYREKEL